MCIRGAFISTILAGVFYLIILFAYKLMGKREISQLGIFDVVINLIIADVAATGIVEEKYWLDSLGGLAVLVMLQILVAKLQLRFPTLRKRMDGESSLIIANGQIDYDELKKIRIQLDELMMLLRQSQVSSVEVVQYALIEANGKLSVYTIDNPTKVFPLPLIISSQIKTQAIDALKITEDWVLEELTKNEAPDLKLIKYMFYEGNDFIIHTKTDIVRITVTPPKTLKEVHLY